VVLDGKDRQLPVPQSLNGMVVEVDVSNLERRRTGNGAVFTMNGEAVIL
jgi:hypothetical protein